MSGTNDKMTLFSRVTKISINESIFVISPSTFLCVIPIGGTKGLCNLNPNRTGFF